MSDRPSRRVEFPRLSGSLRRVLADDFVVLRVAEARRKDRGTEREMSLIVDEKARREREVVKW